MHAESVYSMWTGGVTMRAAPESFVQTMIAQKLHEAGTKLFLEASVKQLMKFTQGQEDIEDDTPSSGRIDIATYFESRKPRFLIEIKKLGKKESFRADHDRIVKLMKVVPSIQNGFLVGYTTAANKETVTGRLLEPVTRLKVRMVRKPDIISVKSIFSKQRYLGAAVYRIDHEATAGDA
jgi:hypothetical protein